MTQLENLLAKIQSRSATVGVIGLGYVGLPLALVFEEAGFPVFGVVPAVNQRYRIGSR